ncbi:hypothetical protein [Siccibacter colletis]|uniref:hypothetical protein n=1 Tax=Siccibacter colletis TaxID=1505757 RepID=UPI003CE6B30A
MVNVLLEYVFPAMLIIFIVMVFFILPYRQRNLSRQRTAQVEASGRKKKISTVSTMLRIFGSSRSYAADYYFDDLNFYQIRETGETTVPLAAITAVVRESTQINNRSVWSVSWCIDGDTHQARFLHNFTFFNRNFSEFLAAVRRANPNAQVRKLTLFSL